MQLEPLEVRVMLSTTYLVNTEHDVPLAAVQPGLGWDTNGNGEISLRSAIEAVNYEAANDPSNGPFTIDIPAGTYDLTLGELDLIPANGVTVTFAGQLSGQQSPVIDAQGQSRVLEIQSGTTPATIGAGGPVPQRRRRKQQRSDRLRQCHRRRHPGRGKPADAGGRRPERRRRPCDEQSAVCAGWGDLR